MAAGVSLDIPEPGTLLAHKYRIEGVLGAGGMGVVLAARHVQLEERVAVKLLHPNVARGPGAIDRFLREARVAKRLRGEHVVRIHDLGTRADGLPFIVMEYLEGCDLGSLLRDRGAIPIADAVDFVLQACAGIAEAHSIGVVHRDLKPPNLFLTTRVDRTPCVKVLDFGISKVLRHGGAGGAMVLDDTVPPSSHDVAAGAKTAWELADTVRSAEQHGCGRRGADATGTHAIMGSPRYMAPEQIRCARDVDARADIWSLGVILYELMSGVLPFDADNLEHLHGAVLGHRARPLRTVCAVPPALEHAIETCLAKRTSDRFQDVHAFARAIAPFASDEGRSSAESIARMTRAQRSESLSGAGSLTKMAAIAVAPPWRHGWRIMTALAALALFVAGAAGSMRRSRIDGAGDTETLPALSALSASIPRSRELGAPSAASATLDAPSAAAPAPPRRGSRPAAKPSSREQPIAVTRAEPSRIDPLGLDGGFLFDEPH